MFSPSLVALFSSVSVAVLLGALWTLYPSYSHDDLAFLLETKMCAHAAREWKLTDCTELGRSCCSSLLTGAGTGYISVGAEPIKAAWGAFGLEASVGQVSVWRLSWHSPVSSFLKEVHSNMRTVTALLCWTWSSALFSEKEGSKLGRFFSRTLIRHWFVPDFPLTLAAFPLLSTHSPCLESVHLLLLSVLQHFSKRQFSQLVLLLRTPKLYRLQ